MPNYSVHMLQLEENAEGAMNQFFIRIDSGPADGLEFLFGEIKFLDGENEGTAQFEYEPLTKVEGVETAVIEAEVANVLQQIIEEMAARDTEQSEELDEDDRNTDSDESITE